MPFQLYKVVVKPTSLISSENLRRKKKLTFFIAVTPRNKDFFSQLPHANLICSAFAGKSLIHRFLWENFYLPFLLVTKKIDILFAPAGILPKLFLPASCKYVTVCQNMLPFAPEEVKRSPSLIFRLKFKLLYFSQIFSFRRSDLVIFISHHAQQVILPLVKKQIRSVVIPHGIPSEFKNDQKQASPFPFNYVLYVSSFFEYKAQLQVIASWKDYLDQSNSSEKLVLLGYDKTNYGETVRREIINQSLSDKVMLISAIPYQDLPPYYQNARALIFASSCENCPNILLESLASGRPVLSSSYPPMPEFAGEAALYFNPYKTHELTQKLIQLQIDAQLGENLGRKGKEQVSFYTIEKTVKETWNSVFDVLS